jgi:hypothetical protein
MGESIMTLEPKTIVRGHGLTEEDLEDLLDTLKGKTILSARQIKEIADLVVKGIADHLAAMMNRKR